MYSSSPVYVGFLMSGGVTGAYHLYLIVGSDNYQISRSLGLRTNTGNPFRLSLYRGVPELFAMITQLWGNSV